VTLKKLGKLTPLPPLVMPKIKIPCIRLSPPLIYLQFTCRKERAEIELVLKEVLMQDMGQDS